MREVVIPTERVSEVKRGKKSETAPDSTKDSGSPRRIPWAVAGGTARVRRGAFA